MRIAQLDGLRAIAIFLVLLIHHHMLSFGWVGVDLFFVLSGFLITGILRRERTKPAYWRSFYIKRATRILPPVMLLLVFATIILRRVYPAYAGYLLFGGNMLELTRYAVPLLAPLWSLAVEEHFYLIWPFVVKQLSRRQLLAISAGIVALSPLLRAVATLLLHARYGVHTEWNSPISLLTPFRLDGLAAGAFIALALETPASRVSRVLGRASGILALAGGTLFVALSVWAPSFRRESDSLLSNSLACSIAALMAMGVVAYLVIHTESFAARALRSKALVFLGSISYGIYLFQGVAMALVSHAMKLIYIPFQGQARMLPADFAVTVLIAWASFYFIEKPSIEWGKGWAHRLRPRASYDTVSR